LIIVVVSFAPPAFARRDEGLVLIGMSTPRAGRRHEARRPAGRLDGALTSGDAETMPIE
jgi:hypothetical protein